MRTKDINKDSYIFHGILKATAGAALALLASGAQAGALVDVMGRWMIETSATMQAATAYSSESGSPTTTQLQSAAPFDAESLAADSNTADGSKTSASADARCRDAAGRWTCAVDTNDPAATSD
ncbi:MAG: hypothetical protein EPN57_26030, partial [Paraburkholderia sp.]